MTRLLGISPVHGIEVTTEDKSSAPNAFHHVLYLLGLALLPVLAAVKRA